MTDLLITWHESCDYPIARSFLKRYRNYFGKIIIYFSKHFREPVYTEFLKESMKDLGNILFLDPIEYKYGVEDWRNVSTNYMLKYSNSEWVCSVEQDYFVRDWDLLLVGVDLCMVDYDLIGWWQLNNKYIHPSFWFIKRELLEKTKKDFAAHDGHDHFGWITKDVELLKGRIMTTQEMGFEDFKDSFHLGGVNQNYLEGLKEGFVFHRPEIFSVYNHFSQLAEVPQSPEFMELMKKIEVILPPKIEDLEKWSKFFT